MPVDDTDALCTALRNIRDRYDEYNLKQISDDCVNSYSSNSVARRLISEFESVIKKQKS